MKKKDFSFNPYENGFTAFFVIFIGSFALDYFKLQGWNQWVIALMTGIVGSVIGLFSFWIFRKPKL